MLDALLNWILDGVEAALAAMPEWSPTLPGIGGLGNPLSEINWLVAVDVPFGIALGMLLLGPTFFFVTLTLFIVGLFTPTRTSR